MLEGLLIGILVLAVKLVVLYIIYLVVVWLLGLIGGAPTGNLLRAIQILFGLLAAIIVIAFLLNIIGALGPVNSKYLTFP